MRNRTTDGFINTHISDPRNNFVGMGKASFDKVVPARVGVRPEWQAALTKEVFVIKAEFFEAGAGYVGQLEFHLFGCTTCYAAFGNILHAGPRGLYHLVVRAAAQTDVSVAETNGEIVYQLRHDEALQAPVTTVWREEWLRFVSVTLCHDDLDQRAFIQAAVVLVLLTLGEAMDSLDQTDEMQYPN